jgi:dynein heavy chain 1
VRYSFNLGVTYFERQQAAVALIKRLPVIEPTRPLQQQLQLIQLGAGDGVSPYEVLHSYVHLTFGPLLDAVVQSRRHGPVRSGDGDFEATMGIPAAKKKIAELELSLRNLQQNVEIPDLTLPIHTVVQKIVEKVRATRTDETLPLFFVFFDKHVADYDLLDSKVP